MAVILGGPAGKVGFERRLWGGESSPTSGRRDCGVYLVDVRCLPTGEGPRTTSPQLPSPSPANTRQPQGSVVLCPP